MQGGCSSSSYVSDSKSDSKSYGEEDWLFRVGSDNYSEYKTLEKNSRDFPTSKLHTTNVPSFGDYVERHDWIECLSRSIPGKMYYYNLRSGCSTWNRPLSRYIHIPRDSRREWGFNDVQCYLRSPSSLVSNDNDNCCSADGSSIKLQEKTRQREWILEQLYYNPKKSKNDYLPRLKKKLSNNNRRNSQSTSSSSDSMCYNDDGVMMNENDISSVTDNSFKVDETRFIDVTNFLECNLSEHTEFERCVDAKSLKTKLTNNIYNSDENDSDFYSSIDNKENDVRLERFVPRLKKIRYQDMLLEKEVEKKKLKPKKPKKKARGNSTKDVKKEETRKPNIIICNMYGITTVNYDNYEQEPQPIANTCNLSDSSTDILSTKQDNHSRSSHLKHFGRDDLDDKFPPLMLSDSNSSTTSSSSSFTCNTCSSASSTTSASTTE
ncbi:hypothetical protein KPH14_011896 [Odynerus spinipes]|uniref:WW domain-containing protein n=1 Tax=Odynerus spinipes TaxID=1348599 RepID=A0AAD9RA59_9HYME|nr:hypothetical protein KPH14_011896 [Odynerus spinipes]